MPINTEKTGAAIAAHRQRMHMSQQALAGLMNVTHQAVSKWEKGLALPDTETLLALAKLFGVSMEDLLMGMLPAAHEAEQADDEPIEASAEKTGHGEAEPVQACELGDLDFSSIMNMMPFVSTEAADRLFRVYTQNSQPDARALNMLAPFVSADALADYVSTYSFKADSPEVAASLAPFLPTKAVDDMILNRQTPLAPHVLQMLLPFASTNVLDQLVMGKMGVDSQNSSGERPVFSMQLQDKVHQKIRRKLDALGSNASSHPLSADAQKEAAHSGKRESPRTRLIRKAGETGDAPLLTLLCESVGELDPDEQFELVNILINGKMYGELAAVIDELEEDAQHRLLDIAFEINDPELLHVISEHL